MARRSSSVLARAVPFVSLALGSLVFCGRSALPVVCVAGGVACLVFLCCAVFCGVMSLLWVALCGLGCCRDGVLRPPVCIVCVLVGQVASVSVCVRTVGVGHASPHSVVVWLSCRVWSLVRCLSLPESASCGWSIPLCF